MNHSDLKTLKGVRNLAEGVLNIYNVQTPTAMVLKDLFVTKQ